MVRHEISPIGNTVQSVQSALSGTAAVMRQGAAEIRAALSGGELAEAFADFGDAVDEAQHGVAAMLAEIGGRLGDLLRTVEAATAKLHEAFRPLAPEQEQPEAATPPSPDAPEEAEEAEVRAAVLAGYEGERCPGCGDRRLVRSGTEEACDSCGYDTRPKVSLAACSPVEPGGAGASEEGAAPEPGAADAPGAAPFRPARKRRGKR